jgi:RNA polymerase sigma factor (sigma-70 family)
VAEEAQADWHLDDATLLNQVRAGDSAAFEVLYQRHQSAARRLSRSLTGPAERDDAVADAFARVLDVTERGGGPTDAFRPYLLAALRRVCSDRASGQQTHVPTDARRLPDPGQPFPDPALAGLKKSVLVQAFLSLPERWSAVLWHTEIEGATPADVAPIFGLTRGGVSALRRRAREGLRQAFLQLHVSTIARPECRPIAERLGAFVGLALSRQDASVVRAHLSQCRDCSAVHAELADLTVALRSQVAPVYLGGAAAAYLSGGGHRAPAGAAAAGGATGAAATADLGSEASRRAGGTARMTGTAAGGTADTARTTGTAALGAGTAGTAAGGTAGTAGTTGTAALGAAGTAGSLPAGSRGLSRLRRMPRQRRWLAAGAAAVAAAIAVGAWALTLTGTGSPQRGRSPRAVVAAPSQHPSTAGPVRHRRRRDPRPSAPATTPPTGGQSAVTSPAPTPGGQLAVAISASGARAPGNAALATFQVTDTGSGGTGELTASITLPSGSWLIGSGQQGWQGWSCQADSTGASCQHGPIAAGSQAPGVIVIGISGSAACGQPVGITVSGGTTAPASAQSGGIQCGSGGWPPWPRRPRR